MQTILDLKKGLIDSGWWDIEERTSSDGWGDGKIGYTIWIRRPDWHGKDAFSLAGKVSSCTQHATMPLMKPRLLKLSRS